MAKLGIVSLLTAALATLTLVTLAPSPVDAAAPCKTKEFKTVMVKDACVKGGQKAAKDEMKKWMKVAKKKRADVACATCHSKVGGAYPLKADGLKLFTELGGK
jgi:mono/diheme cytochrome c family protein